MVIVATASPVPPGNSRFDGDGVATAEMVRFVTLADWLSAFEPEPRPTTQLVAAYAPPPANSAPIAAETTMDRRDQNLVRLCNFWGLALILEDNSVPPCSATARVAVYYGTFSSQFPL